MWCASWLCPPMPSRPLRVPADQVEQREEIDPDNVDEVPVEAEVQHKGRMARGVSPGPGAQDHESQYPDADNHVQGVHAGHEEVERKVKLGVARHIQRKRLVVIFRKDFRLRLRIDKGLQTVVKSGNVMLLDLLPVLDGLDAQKTQAQQIGRAS